MVRERLEQWDARQQAVDRGASVNQERRQRDVRRLCAWEICYYAPRLKFRKAFRRLAGSVALRESAPASFRDGAPASLRELTVYYPTVRQLRAAFAPNFHLQRWTGIGLLVPPSYVKLPAFLVNRCAAIDRLLARIPLLKALADHRLLLFVRK